MFTNKIRYLIPFLKIYKGMKPIILEKLHLKLEIVNGSIDYIKNISLSNVKWIKKM
jgi:hypothetical protein